MATVFMKWLETRPQDYDRGISVLTFGRLKQLQAEIINRLIHDEMNVLEIGCGTGALTIAMAQSGARVIAIDIAPAMLVEAENRARHAGFEAEIDFRLMDASLIGENFPPASFDLIVSSLAFSEMASQAQVYVLQKCRYLLASGGRLSILDETSPKNLLARLILSVMRLPLRLITWLLTRTTTKPLRDFEDKFAHAGFRSEMVASRLGGTLSLFIADPVHEDGVEFIPSLDRFKHRTSLRTLLIDMWALFLRILPPYPKVNPGVYVVGRPGPDSPVLVTGNFDLTVRRLVKAIDGRISAWVLVVDSAGINVWCAAGGGFLNADKVIGALHISGLERLVHHRALILPQLCANGVDGWRIRRETNWGVHWGPVRAEDIPDFVDAGRVKTDEMRWVQFPLKDRLEMVTATLGFYGLFILLPVAIFWRSNFWLIFVSMVGISYFYAVVLPWLPGRDGIAKSVSLTLITLAGLVAFCAIYEPLPSLLMFRWVVGLVALSVFSAAELQGMSPLMRGEQANWSREAIIFIVLGLIYWLVPLALGWR
jgi:ubiquinone/menaquinone biosynthesis C-methylase UbiE